jgi:hypothetical protein
VPYLRKCSMLVPKELEELALEGRQYEHRVDRRRGRGNARSPTRFRPRGADGWGNPTNAAAWEV